MTDPKLRELRRKLDSIPRGRGRRIPLELRARVTAWVAKRREARRRLERAGPEGRRLHAHAAAVVDAPVKSTSEASARRGRRASACRADDRAHVADRAADRGLANTDVIAILRGLA